MAINYLAQMPQIDLGESLLQGLQLGGAIRQQRQEREQQEAAAAMKQQYAADVHAAFANPTPRAFAQLVAKYPGQHEALKPVLETMTQEQRDGEFRTAAEIYHALNTGAVDTARAIADEQIAARRNSGMPTQDFERIKGLIDSDQNAALGYVGFGAALADPKKWAEVMKIGQEAADRPDQVRKLRADATRAEAEAVTAGAQADIAPERLRADVGLTTAQTANANASTKKALVEAAKTAREMDGLASGALPREKAAEMEAKLRSEYNAQTKIYQEVKQAYGRALASEDTAAGDIALIFSYMKLLDPGSVVREGEFATAQNAAGVPDRVVNLYNKILSGERLNSSQRASFRSQADKLFKSAGEQEAIVRSGLTRIAKQYGASPDNIFYEAVESSPTAQAAPTKPPAAPAAGAPTATGPNGQKLILQNGQWVPHAP